MNMKVRRELSFDEKSFAFVILSSDAPQSTTPYTCRTLHFWIDLGDHRKTGRPGFKNSVIFVCKNMIDEGDN